MLLLERVDQGRNFEAPRGRAAEEGGDFVDSVDRGGVAVRFDFEAAGEVVQQRGGVATGQRSVWRQRFQLRHDGEVVVDERPAREVTQCLARAAGNMRLARGQVDVVDLHAPLRLESVAQELDHGGAREVVLAQSEQRRHAASDALRDQRRGLFGRRSETVLRGEAMQQVDVVRIEHSRDDADVPRRNSPGEQLGDLLADAAHLLDAVLVLPNFGDQWRMGFSPSSSAPSSQYAR